jgi:hypothetical protein
LVNELRHSHHATCEREQPGRGLRRCSINLSPKFTSEQKDAQEYLLMKNDDFFITKDRQWGDIMLPGVLV